MSYMDKFEAVPRMYDTIYQHKEKPIWIVGYPSNGVRESFFMAYEVRDYELPLKKGKRIWAHDNRSISPKDGWNSLEEAMEAVA